MPYSEKHFIDEDRRIALYKRPDLARPKWQARISVPNATGYKVISTKTSDFEKAKHFARNKYEELYMQVKAGGALNSKTFKQVFEEWKGQTQQFGRTSRGGSWQATIDRVECYALPFFSSMRIDEIKGPNFVDYWSHRESNSKRKSPAKSTLKREAGCIRTVFNFALARGYIITLPVMHVPSAKSERRPTFTDAEWATLEKAMVEWRKEGKGLATQRDRQMAVYFFAIMANTGLRTKELRNLRWRDITKRPAKNASDKAAYYRIGYVRGGKTGDREFVFNPGCEAILSKLYLDRCKELSEDSPNEEALRPKADEFIFCHPDGSPIHSYKRSFKSLLEYAKIPISVDGRARTTYSLRHFYATRQLSKEASAYIIAKQMGTSVEMLEKHYGQVIASNIAEQITKAAASDIVIKGDHELPV